MKGKQSDILWAMFIVRMQILKQFLLFTDMEPKDARRSVGNLSTGDSVRAAAEGIYLFQPRFNPAPKSQTESSLSAIDEYFCNIKVECIKSSSILLTALHVENGFRWTDYY